MTHPDLAERLQQSAATAPQTQPLDAVIGQPVPRLDGPAKVSGAATYTDDLSRPRMLHAAVLGSPYPHARILGYDTVRARALPGVKAVLTADDLPQRNIGVQCLDEPILARGKTRYTGEPVAAVAAESLAIAREALQLIEVTYEELPAVFDAEEAMAPGAPLLHEDPAKYERHTQAPFAGNVVAHMEVETGSIDDAWSECDIIVEGEYTTPATHHQYMETCSALAEVDGTGKVTVWCSTQAMFLAQQAIATSLGLPLNKVRCIAPAVGGAFGGKILTRVEPIAAALALAARRPVKLVLSRDEDMTMNHTRHAAKIRMKTGARRDGTLLCRDIEVVLIGGAYADAGPLVIQCTVLSAHGPYRIPNIRTVGRVVYTNRQVSSAMRGFGVMQPAFAGESQLDELAAKLQMDPIELRIRNAMQSGDYNLGSHHAPSCHITECLEEIRNHPAFVAASAECVGPTGRKRGVGIAGIMQMSGDGSSSAAVRIAEDGSVLLISGYIDIGNGSDIALAQVCAATLGVGVEQINVVTPDTDGIAYDIGTVADRSSHGVAESVYRASLSVKDKLFQFASEMFECPIAALELRPGGKVGIQGVPPAELPFMAIAQRGLHVAGGPIIGTHGYKMPLLKFDPERTRTLGFTKVGGGTYTVNSWYSYAANAVQVEVDEDTGQVEVIAAWYAADLGRVLNPNSAKGQIYGGVAYGISSALYEELVWDNGRLTNPTLMDYKIVGSHEVPADIYAILLENPLSDSPWGAKSMSDLCVIGAAPAIANAIANAVGTRVRALPMTAERVLDALPQTTGEHIHKTLPQTQPAMATAS